jgi:hypothetical protein
MDKNKENAPQLLRSAEVLPCLYLIRNHFIKTDCGASAYKEGRKIVNDVGYKRVLLLYDALLRGRSFILLSLPFHDTVRTLKFCILLTLISYAF